MYYFIVKKKACDRNSKSPEIRANSEYVTAEELEFFVWYDAIFMVIGRRKNGEQIQSGIEI